MTGTRDERGGFSPSSPGAGWDTGAACRGRIRGGLGEAGSSSTGKSPSIQLSCRVGSLLSPRR